MRRYFIIPALWLVLAGLAAGPVYAACTSPAGNEGDQIYNLAFHTPQFCNGTNWIAMGAPGGGGSLILISTQTASSSASLQFTNLPTSYNTLFLNCSGLLMSNSSTTVLLQVGEGAGPTWETGANYTAMGYGTSGNTTLTTATDLLLTRAGSYWGSTTVPASLKAYFDNVGSASVYKRVAVVENIYVDGAGEIGNQWDSYWAGDANPVTAIRLTVTGGTISSGTCSLYGMN
jgi:hypothetical protein